LRKAQQREATDARRIDHRFEIAHEIFEAEGADGRSASSSRYNLMHASDHRRR
jgi:hypothetical protein